MNIFEKNDHVVKISRFLSWQANLEDRRFQIWKKAKGRGWIKQNTPNLHSWLVYSDLWEDSPAWARGGPVDRIYVVAATKSVAKIRNLPRWTLKPTNRTTISEDWISNKPSWNPALLESWHAEFVSPNLSHWKYFWSRFAEVISFTNPSAYHLLLLIQRTSRRICVGIHFCKTTFKTLCVRKKQTELEWECEVRGLDNA